MADIDSVNNAVRIGFIADSSGSGNPPLEIVTSQTEDIPIAKIYFKLACDPNLACETEYIYLDTTQYVNGDNVFSTVLTDTLGYTVRPQIQFDYVMVDRYQPGEVNNDCKLNVSDPVYLIKYIFEDGAEPICFSSGYANGDDKINISDPVYLINYIFRDGEPPVPMGWNEESFAKLKPYSAELDISIYSANEQNFVELNTEADISVQGVQLEFGIKGLIHNIQAMSNLEGIQVFYSRSGDTFKVGLIDVNGEHMISAGLNHLVDITYEGDGEVVLDQALLVDTHGNPMNTKINARGQTVPDQFELLQNYPNPFNPTTEISYNIESSAQVSLEVYNILGQKVKTLVNEKQDAGNYSVVWDSRDDNGDFVASGVYFYRLNAGDFTASKKMLLMK
jgi:hypothetical protein